MKMETEELKLEEQEVEETTPLVRKSRNGDGEVSNGVSKSNGHTIQLEITQNEDLNTPAEEVEKIEESDRFLEDELESINWEQVIEESDRILENKSESINGVHKIEESDRILENTSESINGEQKIGHIDRVLEHEPKSINGEQKIEECDRVLENESEPVIEDGDRVFEHESEAINGELKPDNLVFHDKVEGVNSASKYIGEEQILQEPLPVKLDVSSHDFIVQNNSTSEINDRYEEKIEENGVSSSHHQHSDTSIQERGKSYVPSKEIESAEIDLINVDDLEITELDVERVVRKQTTHDLFCPNCKSCITKRVILHKRKRRTRTPDEEAKRNRVGAEVGPTLDTISSESPEDQVYQEGEVGSNDAQVPRTDEDGRDREPDLFRCLSCFSFFIPTGDGFKLFKTNWFTKMFVPNKQETTVQQGSSSSTNVQQFNAVPSSGLAHQSVQPSYLEDTGSVALVSEGREGTTGTNVTQEGRDIALTLPNLKPSANGKVTSGVGGKLDMKATEGVGLEGSTWINAADEDMDMPLTFSNLKPSVNGNATIGVGGKLDMKATEAVASDVFTMDQLMESKPSQEVHTNGDYDLPTTLPMKTQVTNGESAEYGMSFPQQDGLSLLIASNEGSSVLKTSEEDTKPNQIVHVGDTDKEVIQFPPPSVSVVKASDVDGTFNISVSIPHEEQDVTATVVTKSPLENKSVDSRSTDSGEVSSAEVSQQRIMETKIEVHQGEQITTEFSSTVLDVPLGQGKDTVITIGTQSGASSHIMEDVIPPSTSLTAPQLETQISAADRERTAAGEERKVEVIKNIVYGGLAESITSLSVVSSAVGGGAATLNVLALGAANLIGGLFVISHNLWDLRCDGDDQVSNQITEQKDRYRELLGRRQNFMIHAVVAIISYLVFGLVTPVVYGFSYRESDDKELKLVVAASSSLVCILMLAIGKAYMQRPPKPYLKTITTFIILGFMVSGVSYAAGHLIERLLEKLGLFKASSPAPNLLLQEMKPVGSAWASY